MTQHMGIPYCRRPTLADETTERLLEFIRSNGLQPGDFLPPQKSLASQLGVSPSTLREAIQALTAMGIVQSQSGKGTWICADAFSTLISPSVVRARLGALDAVKVYEARSAVEVALAELAAHYATPADMERIWEAQRNLEETINDPTAFTEADLRFHLAVADASHNDLLIHFYGLARRLVTHVVTELVQLPQVRVDSVALQRAIAEAIEARDPGRAREAALAHMRYLEPFFHPAEH